MSCGGSVVAVSASRLRAHAKFEAVARAALIGAPGPPSFPVELPSMGGSEVLGWHVGESH